MTVKLNAGEKKYYEQVRVLNAARLELDKKMLSLEFAARKAKAPNLSPEAKAERDAKVRLLTSEVATLRKTCKSAEQKLAKIGIDLNNAGGKVPYRYTAKEVIEELQRTMQEAEADQMNVKWDVQNSIYEEFVELLRVTGYGT